MTIQLKVLDEYIMMILFVLGLKRVHFHAMLLQLLSSFNLFITVHGKTNHNQ